ncbi:MAG TPA: hypothetical protein VNJ08_15940 [Bacteriovoracaceae bacterium]|nr:hypothetical protein [Bacteriovoracaceae bacterium]
MPKKRAMPETPEELFTQVIAAASPEVLKLWEDGDRMIGKESPSCPEELVFTSQVGRSYYQCQPHLWQCYWQGGVTKSPSIKVDLFGQSYHVKARAVFDPIKSYSSERRFYQMFKRETPGINLHYGYVIELSVKEIPGYSQPMILSDSCRDVYLPERIYGYGKVNDRREEGFVWDNFDRRIFIDKFYVSNQQVNEWHVLNKEEQKIITDRKLWPRPALLSIKDQKRYCSFLGKRLLEAKLFDAATMTPTDMKNPTPDRILRPQTPWQRDLSKSFLGMSRINPDYQLAPLDCQLAQVKGCDEKHFTTDSTTWMGVNYALGFYPESLNNPIDPNKNVKLSSRFLLPQSEWHELGVRSSWTGEQTKELPVAFRCYEEVVP